MLWFLVTALTMIGVVGVAVDVLAFFAIHGPLTGGCAMGGVAAVLMLVAALLVLGYVALIGGLATVGLIDFWRQSRWGPRLLILANLLAMAFFFWSPVNPGQLGWAVVLVLFGIAPAVAVVLLFWALLSRGTGPVRVAELVVLGLIALPLAWAFEFGISTDVTGAMKPAPQLIAARGGCGAPAELFTAGIAA